MVTSMLRNALRQWGAPRPPRGSVALQHLGLSSAGLELLRQALQPVGEELAVNLELHGHAGDIVLLDVPFAARLSPQLVHAFTEGRPVVLLGGSPEESDPLLSAAQRLEHCQQVLIRQLREIALVRARSAAPDDEHWATRADAGRAAAAPVSPALGVAGPAASGFDSHFDSQLDATQLQAAALQQSQLEVLQQVMLALVRKDSEAYCASYGPEAHMRFDFAAGLVFLDRRAEQMLRVRRELPQPAPGTRTRHDALVCELEDTLWHLGIAAGPYPLLDQPADWWHVPLHWTGVQTMERYSRNPRHLELARRLIAGAVTPSTLRRHGQVAVGELRRFIQAALMLGLVNWTPQPPAFHSAAVAESPDGADRAHNPTHPTHPNRNARTADKGAA